MQILSRTVELKAPRVFWNRYSGMVRFPKTVHFFLRVGIVPSLTRKSMTGASWGRGLIPNNMVPNIPKKIVSYL